MEVLPNGKSFVLLFLQKNKDENERVIAGLWSHEEIKNI